MLIARGRLKHQYPHSWRSKKPVIFRNTPQWFIAMDKPIADADGQAKAERHAARPRAEAIEVTRWVPPQGENRITGMIESRPDWVISRQRAWGVPITVFVRENGDGSVEILNDERVNERIADAFEQEGADAWYATGARGALPRHDYDPTSGRRSTTSSTSGSTPARPTPSCWRIRALPALAGIKRKMDGGPTP